MLSVAEAQQIVLQHTAPLTPEVAPLSSSTLNLVLAENVAADIDMPPYDKSLMDGFAVRSEDVKEDNVTLTVVEEISAGQTPKKTVGAGEAAQIMTGAPIPDGADAVVMKERTEVKKPGGVVIQERAKAGQNILQRGREMKQGEIILAAGSRLRPQEFGLLAAVGKTAVTVHPAPVIAVLSTGDELVDPFVKPGPGQIRNSNGTMLVAQVARAGGLPKFLGIARDTEESLTKLISEGLQADVLILSGGVSAGKKDLVPSVLEKLGVKARFHKVEMKPGKPVFFGTVARSRIRQNSGSVEVLNSGEISYDQTTLVFGLPGNPVSSLVCFELFVRPALRRLQNQTQARPTLLQATLTEDFNYRSDRPTYHPARLRWRQGKYEIQLIPWFGSADLRGLIQADALAIIDKGEHQFKAGQVLDVLPVE